VTSSVDAGRENAAPETVRSADGPTSEPVDLFLRIHALSGEDMLVVCRDFCSEVDAAQAIAQALDDRRSLTFAHASFSRESQESVVVVNPSNVVAIRISRTDSAATGQYL
jgi:hypothetical protein